MEDKNIQNLERLTEKFGRKYDLIEIQGQSVYGCTSKERKYLGPLAEYTRYKRLKLRYKRGLEQDGSIEDKDEKRAYKLFLESSRSRRITE